MTNLAAAVELVDKWCRESSEWKADKRKQLIPSHFDLGRIKALDQCAAELKTILAELGTGAGGDDMLPDALMPVSKEWYVLCERRFAVDKITISGDLARAIVDAMRNKPSPIETPTYQYVPTQRAGQSTEEYEKSVIDEANRILATRPPVAGLAECVCTCPSGDGSLRYPCPKHPPMIATEEMIDSACEAYADMYDVEYIDGGNRDNRRACIKAALEAAFREFLGKVDGC